MSEPDILFEDDFLIALNKPFGIPAVQLPDGTGRSSLADWIITERPECAGASEKPSDGGLCHRLDTETSGVIVAAKTPEAFLGMREIFSNRMIEKRYSCLVEGEVTGEGTLRTYLFGRYKRSKKMSVVSEEESPPKKSRLGELEWEALEYRKKQDATYLSINLLTGIRHQIRAQLAFTGHPLVGDALYGSTRELEGERDFFLHATLLKFVHPITGKEIQIECELPPVIARSSDL